MRYLNPNTKGEAKLFFCKLVRWDIFESSGLFLELEHVLIDLNLDVKVKSWGGGGNEKKSISKVGVFEEIFFEFFSCIIIIGQNIMITENVWIFSCPGGDCCCSYSYHAPSSPTRQIQISIPLSIQFLEVSTQFLWMINFTDLQGLKANSIHGT